MRKIYIVPNIFTAFSLSCGLFVIFKMNLTEQGVGIFQVLQTSTILLLLASVADWIDGALARAIHAESSFGFLFDSMADAITFGVAPSVIVLKSLSLPLDSPLAILAVVGSMLFSICGILRLVRFNVKESEAKSKTTQAKQKHFTGLPIPAAALAVVGTNFLFAYPPFEAFTGWNENIHCLIISGVMVVLAYFMVSRFKFPSAKMLHFRMPSFPLVFVIVVFALFLLYGVLYFLPITLAVATWTYILLAWTFAVIRLIAGKKSKTLADFEPDEDA
jgi:CDP-diacylglycerol--serine O-phosphatidyltransferase